MWKELWERLTAQDDAGTKRRRVFHGIRNCVTVIAAIHATRADPSTRSV